MIIKSIFAILFALSLNATVIDGVAIIVKGSAITLYDIKKQMQLTGESATKSADILIRKKLEELEIDERKITVSSQEVYEDIKQAASRNNMDISDFYEAVRNTNGLSSAELKEQIKQKLLSQKLYSAIAYSSVSQPDEKDIEDYYKLHKDQFNHPSSFDVTIYVAQDQARLQEKIDNPMFYSPDIQTQDQTLLYSRISPDLAKLLQSTPLNTFSTIVPNGKAAFMSFYLKSVESSEDGEVGAHKDQIISQMMASQREQLLGDYFARLKLNADIKHIRMPE